MASRDHYVSQFFLSHFTDPTVMPPEDPWLWIIDLPNEEARRRAPKNVGWARDLFAGPVV